MNSACSLRLLVLDYSNTAHCELCYMNTQSVLITLTQATLVHIRQTEWQCCVELVAGGTAGETSLSEMTWAGSPPPPGQNIRGGESSTS